MNLVSQVTRSAYLGWPSFLTQSPMLASPPLSPERPCTNVPSGSLRVSVSVGAGYGDGRCPSAGSIGTSAVFGSSITSVVPS